MEDPDEIARLIGARLRAGRASKKLTLDKLGEITGLSSAFLSRLERGETSTSIGNLIRVTGAVGLSLEKIFESDLPAEASNHVLSRRKERQARGQLSGPNYAFERIQGPHSEHRLEVFELEYPVGSKQDSPLMSHEGAEEVLYLLAGRLQFQVGDNQFVMEAGDCLHLHSHQPHRGWNIGNRPARLLMVVSAAGGAARPRKPQVIHVGSQRTARRQAPRRR